ncbi:MAG: lactate utilization protein C [Gammaproteobacteria bacterium]|nr:lactate utilization protein C [Gammaproteobacteria bacterium]
MNSARDEILARIRGSLHCPEKLEPDLQRRLERRMAAHEIHVQPQLDKDLITQFITKLKIVHVSVHRAADLDEVPKIIIGHIESQSLPPQLVMAKNALLDSIDWPEQLQIERRAAANEDRIAVTGVYAAVAETGSLVLLSDPNSPTTLNFLPEDHIAVVVESQILPHIEDIWAQLRKDYKTPPRTINLITSPSKTADVEQTIHYGAHGPRRLTVILVEQP